MRYLKTSEAAALLNVSPNTLRAWERRFGFPRPRRSEGRHRMFTHGEILALRDALHDGLSISSAISRAREGLLSDGDSLLAALAAFDAERADAAMEATLALRSLERSVEELLLPSLEEVARRHGTEAAAWAFAAHWGTDWLRRARRLSAHPAPQTTVLFGDATRDETDPDAPPLRALELLCARAGIEVLVLSARAAHGVADALATRPPGLIVIGGGHLGNDAVARWLYSARSGRGEVPVLTFRRGAARSGARSSGSLPDQVAQAQEQILELVDAHWLPAPASAAAGRHAGQADNRHSSRAGEGGSGRAVA